MRLNGYYLLYNTRSGVNINTKKLQELEIQFPVLAAIRSEN